MKSLYFDKKGDEKYLSIWWFFIIVIIATGVIVGTILFFSADVDIREQEAKIIQYNFLDCVTNQGFVDEKFLANTNSFDISDCNFKRIFFEQGSQLLLRVEFIDEKNEKIAEPILFGNAAFANDCAIVKNKDVSGENYPGCVYENYSFYYYENSELKKGKMVVLSASNFRGVKQI